MPKPKEYTLYNNFIETATERMIATFWSKLKINQTGDHNKDYGNHCLTMNFPPPQQLQQHQSTKCTGEMVIPLKGGGGRIQGLQLGRKILTSFLAQIRKPSQMAQALSVLSKITATFQRKHRTHQKIIWRKCWILLRIFARY
jgi:hypothetical protein